MYILKIWKQIKVVTTMEYNHLCALCLNVTQLQINITNSSYLIWDLPCNPNPFFVEKTELFLELYGNTLVREQTLQYVETLSTELIKWVLPCYTMSLWDASLTTGARSLKCRGKSMSFIQQSPGSNPSLQTSEEVIAFRGPTIRER